MQYVNVVVTVIMVGGCVCGLIVLVAWLTVFLFFVWMCLWFWFCALSGSGVHVLRPTLIYSIHVSVSVLCAIYFSVVRYSNSVLFHLRQK